jgi:hypothetical protein
MCVDQLFRHQDVVLPKQRDEGDYERYLATVFEAYLRQIDTLRAKTTWGAKTT